MNSFSSMRSRPRFNRNETMIEATDDIIVISSDEDDTASDEECRHSNKHETGHGSSIQSSLPSCIESSDEELTDLPISINDNRITATESSGEKFPASETKKRNQRIDASEPPAKVSKTEANLSLHRENLQLPLLKKKMCNSILRGGFKGKNVTTCNRNFTSCYETHKDQPTSNCTPMQGKNLFGTMMDYDYLQHFALRAMAHRTVTHQQYLHPSLLYILLKYLFGCEQKYEAPDAEGLNLGVSILYKLLKFHPPCKKGMHHIYLKMCQDWFSRLLQRVEALLVQKFNVSKFESMSVQDDIQQDGKETLEDFNEYVAVARKKASEKKQRYMQLTRTEKICHLNTLTRYFSKVMELSFLQWSICHWQKNASALFRKDKCPILSEVVWGFSGDDVGSVNSTVQQLFTLYCASSKEPSLHESFGSLVAICAAILHRKEKSEYPEMGDETRRFAFKLYEEVEASTDIEVNLRNIHPDWLKFHVASLFLGVEEPSNFYKVKEKISKVLQDKDKHKDSNLHYPNFSVERVCLEAIRAMMGMIQLKSSVPEDCDLTSRILEENNAWFSNILQDETILVQLKMIKNTLSIPFIKNNRYHLDGFEN